MSVGKNNSVGNDNEERVKLDDARDPVLQLQLFCLAAALHHEWEVKQVQGKEQPCYQTWLYNYLNQYKCNNYCFVEDTKEDILETTIVVT